MILALYLRMVCFNEEGGDSETFTNAVESFLDGENIYKETVRSYSQESTDNHGYAYFPTLLYIYTPLYLLSNRLNIEPHILFKIPVLLADIFVGVLIFKILYKEEKKLLGRFFGIIVLVFKSAFDSNRFLHPFGTFRYNVYDFGIKIFGKR